MSANQARVLTETGTIVLAISETSMDIPIGQNTPPNAVVNNLVVNGTASLPGASITPAAVNAAIQTSLGTVVLNGATPVAVADAAITANSIVLFTLKTPGGTVGAYPTIETITPGTGFHVAGTALDTSTYNYVVIG